MAELNPDTAYDAFQNGAGAAADKIVNYGNKWLNNKINFGLNYAENYARQLDFFGVLPERWTILDEGGQKAFDFDSFNTASIKSESKVIQAPVEGGSFVMYNKLNTPLELNCTLIKQGYPADLQAYVDALLEYADSTDLLSIVTPDKEYQNMNLSKVSFDRAADKGINLIIADCSFIEVRQVELEFTSAKVAKKASRGRQQTKPTSIIQALRKG